MRRIAVLAIFVSLCTTFCRTPSPSDPSDVDGVHPTAQDESRTPESGVVETATVGSDETDDVPQVTQIIGDLTATISSALSGQDLPDTVFRLPGTRGEQVVNVQSGFPQGLLTVDAAMFKLDITLPGCGESGGFSIGVLQVRDMTRLVGLGDRFTPVQDQPRGLEEMNQLAEYLLDTIEGESATVLSDAECVTLFGSDDLCRRMFRDRPDEATVTRYQQRLSSCDATPMTMVPLVAFWFRDESGTTFQGLAELNIQDGLLALAAPITVVPGVGQ